MTSISSRRIAATASALLAAAALAGCGGEDEASAQECRSQALNAAEAAVVAEYYEQGKLGPKAQVRAQLEQPDMEFFDDQNRMIPYEELSSDEQSVLVLWFDNGRVGRLTKQDRERAAEQADPDC